LIEGDYDRLWEALDNLVNNAIKYTPPGGDIDIVVKPNSQEALIEVRDSGLGLSPQDLGRLFGRFARLSAQPTGGESSTGLGLSIVKKIVDLHGGSVRAESPGPQRGSTFTVSLPLERSTSAA
jgi:signal transduction histidine kinase